MGLSFYKVGSKVYPSELCVRVRKRRSSYWRESQEKRTCQVQVFEVVSPMWGGDLKWKRSHLFHVCNLPWSLTFRKSKVSVTSERDKEFEVCQAMPEPTQIRGLPSSWSSYGRSTRVESALFFVASTELLLSFGLVLLFCFPSLPLLSPSFPYLSFPFPSSPLPPSRSVLPHCCSWAWACP